MPPWDGFIPNMESNKTRSTESLTRILQLPTRPLTPEAVEMPFGASAPYYTTNHPPTATSTFNNGEVGVQELDGRNDSSRS